MRQLFEQGVAAHRTGKLAQAENLYRQVLRADAANFAALHMLGFLKAQQGRYDEAINLLNKAVRQNPKDIAARTHFAHALMAAGRLDEALSAYDRLLAEDPANFEALYNRGVILSEQLRFDEALAALDAAMALKPDVEAIFHNRGVVLTGLERHQDALASYDRALALDPAYLPAKANRAVVILNLCDWERMPPPEELAEIAPPLTFLGYSDSKQLQLQCAKAAMQRLVPALPPPLWQGETYRHDRIRLAYVSADFREHAVAFQLVPLIERHDRARFHAIGISIGPGDDSAIRERLIKGFDRFHDFAKLTSEQIARRLREMEIDIAIDLGGHTGQARPQIFAHRPTPVQASWLGYPGTTGASFMDYLIADAVVAPFEDQPFYSEKLVHLPHSYFPTDPARDIAPLPTRAGFGLPADAFVFCAFHHNWKITAQVFEIWMRLLKAVPKSLLWLKEPVPDARAHLERAALAHGVDPARLVYAGDVPLPLHLARHALADLFLDTLPYNAHATAADALAAGLPVLTCKGEAFAGRVAASLLTACGLPELIAENLTAYEARALELAQDKAQLAGLKEKLRRNAPGAPLFDADAFRCAIEAAYLAMLQNRMTAAR